MKQGRWRMMAALAVMLALPGVTLSATRSQAADIAAAVASPSRGADNLKLDASRKPAELLTWLGLKRGMHVADMFGGNLYWSEILTSAVGPSGKVVVWQPTQFLDDKAKARLSGLQARQPNFSYISSPFEQPAFAPKSFDFMLINLDYHDVYWTNAKRGITRMDPNEWLKPIFAAMKPGATVGVVDHVGPAGDTRAIVEKLHRIDPATVRADFERAGFVLAGQSDLLRNPADDHSLLVFDPAIRGKTDRFIFRFKRPR